MRPHGYSGRQFVFLIPPDWNQAITPPDETILILDFGSQYAQLIARRVREAGAFSLLVAPDTPLETLR
ncbi:MAG: hypothetical protein VX563_04915, partial [Planctomycetota bacterium]|nr:hypothetical protein [Planctomycetota bacterium]